VILLSPLVAFAQSNSNIGGVVKDTTGAVLPGVTVEAASPSLIEKARTVVTDSAGQYKIVNLVPGSYTVTFTLQGFNTVRREGIQLTASFTANVNADLRVGSLEETITVTGETPTVDIQSVVTQRVGRPSRRAHSRGRRQQPGRRRQRLHVIADRDSRRPCR
jgi:hypothetical protein